LLASVCSKEVVKHSLKQLVLGSGVEDFCQGNSYADSDCTGDEYLYRVYYHDFIGDYRDDSLLRELLWTNITFERNLDDDCTGDGIREFIRNGREISFSIELDSDIELVLQEYDFTTNALDVWGLDFFIHFFVELVFSFKFIFLSVDFSLPLTIFKYSPL